MRVAETARTVDGELVVEAWCSQDGFAWQGVNRVPTSPEGVAGIRQLPVVKTLKQLVLGSDEARFWKL